MIDPKLQAILPRVEKPGRYVGGEINQVVKEKSDVDVRCALVFPDQYDIGMSYHGFKILYERVNNRPQWWAERAYCPWIDMEAEMRRAGIALWAHESKDPLARFDVLGYSLQHEMNYTNVLNSLDLSGLSPWTTFRKAVFPIVIAGGEGALAPEPMAPFVDVFVTGDGETALDDIMMAVEEFKREVAAEGVDLESLYETGPFAPGKGLEDAVKGVDREGSIPEPEGLKRRLLALIARTESCYVPAFYDFEWKEDGTLERFTANVPDAPNFIKKRQFNIQTDLGVTKPVVPNVRVVHDRVAIEIKRGCNCGCRFCAAGMINRPLRERTPEQILEIARETIKNTGYRDISLMSLSSADYTALPTTMKLLQEEFGANTMGLSLPSLRINAFDVEIAAIIAQGPKSGFTFAPEAGTERLRRVINKAVDESHFRETITKVLERGWRTLKFYFMIGLPTETDSDLDGIVELTKYAEDEGRRIHGKKFSLAITLSPFVPKPHTPFQWHAQPDVEELHRRLDYVKSRARSRFVQVRAHNFQGSFVEALVARGDRDVSRVLHRAWQLGTKFDSWAEGFKFEAWMEACREENIDPTFYANRERDPKELTPWDHVDPSLGKQFLLREWEKSKKEGETPDCALVRCVKCDVCDDKIDNILATHTSILKDQIEEDNESLGEVNDHILEGEGASECEEPIEKELEQLQQVRPLLGDQANEAVMRVRVTYAKTGDLRWLAHLDMTKLMEMNIQRSGIPISYSEGFNPRPRLAWGPPLGCGSAGLGEYVDIQLRERVEPADLLEQLKETNTPNLYFVGVEEIGLHGGKSLSVLAQEADYSLEIVLPEPVNEATLREKLEEFEAAETYPIEFFKKGKKKYRDLKSTFHQLRLVDVGDTIKLQANVSLVEGEFLDPSRALGWALPELFGEYTTVLQTRERIRLAETVSA